MSMLLLTQRRAPGSPEIDLPLTYDLREKSRHRLTLADGREIGWLFDRGRPLADGEVLAAEDGMLVRVVAAPEPLLHVTCPTPTELARAAYHLGNRHVALQVGEGWLRLLDDYVLADMLHKLGADVDKVHAPFQPESGAYGGGHHHGHRHDDPQFRYAPKMHRYAAVKRP